MDIKKKRMRFTERRENWEQIKGRIFFFLFSFDCKLHLTESNLREINSTYMFQADSDDIVAKVHNACIPNCHKYLNFWYLSGKKIRLINDIRQR